MIPASRQRNYLQSALYVVIAGVVAALLLERLLAYAEAAEKFAMEATVSQLNSALYTRVAYLALRGEYEAIEALPRQSPFVTTRTLATNYLGEADGVPADAVGSGKWLFDRTRSQLVYLPNLKRYLSVRSESGSGSEDQIRFRLDLAKASRFTFTGVGLRPAIPYSWEPLP